mmetsp:Transcript_15622/g.26317  ORF Transcript_15622/g.26317 Transcript_15622/m.26317 type:complete len:200 (-) Transcript_15622:1454-2053(-)
MRQLSSVPRYISFTMLDPARLIITLYTDTRALLLAGGRHASFISRMSASSCIASTCIISLRTNTFCWKASSGMWMSTSTSSSIIWPSVDPSTKILRPQSLKTLTRARSTSSAPPPDCVTPKASHTMLSVSSTWVSKSLPCSFHPPLTIRNRPTIAAVWPSLAGGFMPSTISGMLHSDRSTLRMNMSLVPSPFMSLPPKT